MAGKKKNKKTSKGESGNRWCPERLEEVLVYSWGSRRPHVGVNTPEYTGETLKALGSCFWPILRLCPFFRPFYRPPGSYWKRGEMFGRVWVFVTSWTVAHQAPLSMGFSQQEHWNGLSFPPPGYLPNPRIKPTSFKSLALAGRFFKHHLGSPLLKMAC